MTESCQEPIETYDISKDGKEEFLTGHLFCTKDKGHEGRHRVFHPQDPEYLRLLADEMEGPKIEEEPPEAIQNDAAGAKS